LTKLLSLRRLRTDERGIALVVALATTIVLGIMVTAVIAFTSSNQRSSNLNQASVQAEQVAEAGLQQAYSIINYASATGTDPSAPTLLGCGTNSSDTTHSSSDCSSSAGIVVCVTAASGCTAGTAGAVTIWGCYTGTALTSCTMPGNATVSVGKTSTWLIWARGYSRNASAGTSNTVSSLDKATVLVSALNSGAVASVWNHMFVTAPLVPGQCQLDFGGNSTVIDVPIYVIGNLCLSHGSGAGASVQESAGGQAIDMQVGGKLILGGSQSQVGTSSSQPITSGVVVGGCSTTYPPPTTTSPACNPTSFKYWVGTAGTYVPNSQPVQSDADVAADYASFSPGPNQPCTSGSLPSSTWDNDTTQNNSAATFELTPSTSYSCTTSTGALTWNATTKLLTIAGSIFIDGSVTVSQSGQYVGTAVIELAGTFQMRNGGTSLCSVLPNSGSGCNYTNWQGTTSNRDMLTIVSVKQNDTSAITLGVNNGNNQSFQGSLWTQPNSGVNFLANSDTFQGPISVGTFAAGSNNANIKPLPVIKNMPVGAPVPPNSGTSIGPLVYN
jgi:Tfp pilus assembly protein PilX